MGKKIDTTFCFTSIIMLHIVDTAYSEQASRRIRKWGGSSTNTVYLLFSNFIMITGLYTITIEEVR